jgi:hypothetical protein
MEVATHNRAGAALAGMTETLDFTFLPSSLMKQCRSLIESYHELHGYACLPDILWKSRLGPFIEAHQELRHLLKKASTTRSAKKSHDGFVQIAQVILSLEILASSFAGWSAIYPDAGATARAILQRNARGQQMPLMDFYLYPPKHFSSAAVAALVPPASRHPDDATLYWKSRPELAGEKQALHYVKAVRQAQDAAWPRAAGVPSA